MVAERVVAGLKEFRALHAPHFRAHHRIIWPPSLRMLPLYMLGVTHWFQGLAPMFTDIQVVPAARRPWRCCSLSWAGLLAKQQVLILTLAGLHNKRV